MMCKITIFILCCAPIWLVSAGKPGTRIISGSTASNTSGGADPNFPYMASITITKLLGTFYCGGALITDQWVVTAAHCIYGVLLTVTVRLNTTLRTSAATPQTFNINILTNLRIHYAYNILNYNNDIGLIKLPNAITETSSMTRIPVIPEGSSCSATNREFLFPGWGINSTTTPNTPENNLRYTKLVEVKSADCWRILTLDRVIATTFCATSTKTTATGSSTIYTTPCTGDDGGPLVQQISGKDYLVAIFAFSPPTGCNSNDPSGFVSVLPYLNWMRSLGVSI